MANSPKPVVKSIKINLGKKGISVAQLEKLMEKLNGAKQ